MLSPATAPLLAVERLQAWYGESHVLHGATFEVFAGEVATLLGRNGAGKTTTLKSIMGIVGQRTGSVRYEGRELIGRPKASNSAGRLDSMTSTTLLSSTRSNETASGR